MSVYNDDDEGVLPEESNNRTFLLAAGGLGLLMLLALLCLGGYFLFNRNAGQQSAVTAQAQATLQQATIQVGLTQVAGAQAETLTATLSPTNTPVIAQPTATPQPTATAAMVIEIVSDGPSETVQQPQSCQSPANWVSYTVQRSDTLSSLAQRTGTSWQQIQMANCLAGTTIFSGQSLYLPFMPELTSTIIPTETPNPATTTIGTAFTQILVSTQTVASTQPGTLSLQEALDKITQQFQESMKSNLVYTAPESMHLDETVTIELLLNPSMSQAELATQIINQSDLVTSTAQPGQLVNPQGGDVAVVAAEIQITDLMRAELRSTDLDAFTIQLLNPSMDQPISSSFTAKWHWSITAKKAGTKTLVLVISRLMKQDEKELWVEVQSYKANIVVQVAPAQRIKSWDWKWLTTILLIPIAKFLYDEIKRRNSRQDNKVSDQPAISGKKGSPKPLRKSKK